MIAHKIFMVRPAHFGFNPETAVNNVFQQEPGSGVDNLQQQALDEFDNMVIKLRQAEIQVDVLHDNLSEKRLDAIFSNNWISTHPDQTLITYPLFSPIRRKERDPRHIRYIADHYQVRSHLAMEYYEREGYFLEGTGSLVIDHEYGLVFGNRSPRTHEVPFTQFCLKMGYTPVLFDAVDQNDIPVYHTNIVLGIGRGYVIVNKSAIPASDWSKLAYYFNQSDKQIIEISHDQMNSFVGNSAFLHNAAKEPFIVLSQTAYQVLSSRQKDQLADFGQLLPCHLSTIERIGGGSAKCMITENYLIPRWPEGRNF